MNMMNVATMMVRILIMTAAAAEDVVDVNDDL